jgi:hypothetical protein
MNHRILFKLLVVVGSILANAGPCSAEPTTGKVALESGSKFNQALHDELVKITNDDQQARKTRVDDMKPDDWKRMAEVDRIHEIRIREIVDKAGWPGIKLVGADGSQCAWLIVQHCPLDFEEKCLPLLKRAVYENDASPMNYAYLFDRVQMFKGLPQSFGTQFRDDKLWKIEDLHHADERRKKVGLGPLSDYVKKMCEMNGWKFDPDLSKD